MAQVQLNDRIFVAAQRRAADGGYSSVDEYIADIVVHDLGDESGGATPNLDRFFTPDRLARIDKAEADVRAGKGFTDEQAETELARRRAEWLQEIRDN
jgi:hypothetical protein